ncbi:MAG: NupC/NupG family nucleoside CNT transporter [Gammaproteobacteria bacterium]
MQAILGIAVLLGIAWLLSEARGSVRWRPVMVGLLMQFALALVLLRVPLVGDGLLLLNEVVYAIERATSAGAGFVFGYLAGENVPFDVRDPGALYVFAFRVLPQIIVFSVLVALLWYWRVLPVVIRAFGRVLHRSLGVRGAVGTSAASSVFLGMVETPLVIRGYLASLSRSELFTLMTCGMSTVAGSIMVLYAGVLRDVVPGALGHILIASVINVVGAVYLSRIMIPPEDDAAEDAAVAVGLEYTSNMDAITRGTADGLRLAANVGAMLVVLVSLVALVNHMLSVVAFDGAPLTLERAMGWVFAPVAWLMGIPWAEAAEAGALLGVKLILNELVAYLNLAALPGDALAADSRLIMTYALCGFANFGSLGILLGGLGTLIPERRQELLQTAPRTLVSGTLVGCVTGAIVGLVMML